MSVADTLEFDPDRVAAQGGANTQPPTHWYDFNWDATQASAAQAFWDVPGRSSQQRNGEILSASAELARMNGRSPLRYQFINTAPGGGAPMANEDAFWDDLADLRRTHPDALSDFAKDRADYDNRFKTQFQQASADRAQRMGRQGWVGNFIGGAAGSFTDPINAATLPLGGGEARTAAGAILREAATQAGVSAVQQPLVAVERHEQGSHLSWGDAAENVGMAALGGAAFKGAEIGGGKALSAAWDAVPQDVKAAIALRSAKPDFAMTPDQAAALHVVTRGAEIDGSSPFTPTYDGLNANAARIDQTIAAMGNWPQASATPAYAAPRPLSAPGDMAPDLDSAWQAIVGIEGGTNRDGSFRTSPAGAIGPAQVMPATGPMAAKLAGMPWDEAKFRSDPAYNQALGRAYYQDLLHKFDGDPVKAAAAYNAGEGSIRKGTGVRGAMARAERAGVPGEWASFLPAETRAYVANFRGRTGMDGDVRLADAGGIDPSADPEEAMQQAGAIDAQRPAVDVGADLPELDRAQFGTDAEWQRAQGEVDAEAFGQDPAHARQAVWAEARDKLMVDQDGEVPGALWHPDVGPIDLKWGVEGTGKSDGYGLAKIVRFHPEVLDDLPGILEDMRINPERSGNNRMILEGSDHKAVVSLNWQGKEQRWLLSAYEKKKGAPSDLTSRRGPNDVPDGGSTGAGADADIGASGAAGKTPPDAIPATRRGDFFEIEGPQAIRVARELGVTHTTRTRTGEPMVGIPAHAFESWTSELAEKGIHVVDAAAPRPALSTGDVDAPSMRDELEAAGRGGPATSDAEAGKAFDDPAGEGVATASETGWHDIEAGQRVQQLAAEALAHADAMLREHDPAAAEALDRAAEEAARGLPEQLTFDLGDGQGERTIEQIQAELHEDAQAIATIESCLKPNMGGTA